jgi:hypothetical protein
MAFQGNSRLPLRALLAHILATLKETGWFVSGPNTAATGMNRSALQFRMKKLGIVQPGLREAKPPQLTAFDLGF